MWYNWLVSQRQKGPWCRRRTYRPVKPKIAGSSPVGPANQASHNVWEAFLFCDHSAPGARHFAYQCSFVQVMVRMRLCRPSKRRLSARLLSSYLVFLPAEIPYNMRRVQTLDAYHLCTNRMKRHLHGAATGD